MTAIEQRGFDGIICLGGEDWWYHNRGHFDFQVMRRLARDWPVLFVNSLGVRLPTPGASAHDRRLFAHRIARKLQSFGRGLVHVEHKFSVLSPLSVPGAAGQRLTAWALGPQIKRAARSLGMTRPLVWVHCPSGVACLDALNPVATVLQRTDRFEAFPEGNRGVLTRQIAELKRRADLVVYCNPELLAEETGTVRCQLLVDHGVDYQRFADAGDHPLVPADVAGIAGPRVGFIGGIDAHTFDPDLFRSIAQSLPSINFVMVGGCSLPPGWCMLLNVHLLGRRPYDEIAQYMAAMDALIMPWNRSDWIRACNPIKLKEYLAVGRPVVTTDFPALAPWRRGAVVADDAASFAAALQHVLSAPHDATAQRQLVHGESWDAKVVGLRASLLAMGLNFQPTNSTARLAA
jgi:glycosyltransferase involved in cell wall biosynthesis